jgi:hypothetical protein
MASLSLRSMSLGLDEDGSDLPLSRWNGAGDRPEVRAAAPQLQVARPRCRLFRLSDGLSSTMLKGELAW